MDLTRAHIATADVKSNLAPTGTLRVAINYGNAVLAVRDAAGKLHGVSVDIAHELGKRLDLPLTLIPFDAARKVADAASELLVSVFGAEKTSTRLVFGMASLPVGVCVVLESIFEVTD